MGLGFRVYSHPQVVEGLGLNMKFPKQNKTPIHPISYRLKGGCRL